MTRIVWFIALSFISTAHAQSGPPPDAFLVHGVRRTCDSIPALDRALSVEDSSYFAGWSSRDYDTAANWAALCVSDQYRFIGHARAARLRAYQAKMTQPPTPVQPPAPSAEQMAADKMLADEREQQRQEAAKAAAKAEAQQARAEAQQARAEEALEKKRQARSEAIAACRHSGAYRVFRAQQRLHDDIDIKDQLAEKLEHERKIEERSGVQNLTLDYELGERSVQIDEILERDWDAYMGAGGSSTPSQGLQLIENPCPTAKATSDE
jgi:hypothetical protein